MNAPKLALVEYNAGNLASVERAFARFGGYAASCKYDSQKPVVLRWEGQQPPDPTDG